MKYEAPKPISKESVLDLLDGADDIAPEALIRAALTIGDRQWVESSLIKALSDPRQEVRRAALLGFGHLARLYGQLNLKIVVPLLKQYVGDDVLGGTAEDALEDIAIFVRPGSDLDS
ncbi:MAG: hypothetical protein DMF61_23370 [Blastocatellia bacterium AA13]|nr:MAG: hypothetical protein DMF61_23370 [Blastocatellia bacterium AA13]